MRFQRKVRHPGAECIFKKKKKEKETTEADGQEKRHADKIQERMRGTKEQKIKRSETGKTKNQGGVGG